MQVDFYHLTRSPLDRVLPRIAERIVADGGRLLVVVRDDAQAAAIDKLLWAYASDSFLPHGVVGAGQDDAQPVLISTCVEPTNAARHVALVDGKWRDEALTFDRAFHFFDEGAIGEARAAWKVLADREGVERRYWKQLETGGWDQAA